MITISYKLLLIVNSILIVLLGFVIYFVSQSISDKKGELLVLKKKVKNQIIIEDENQVNETLNRNLYKFGFEGEPIINQINTNEIGTDALICNSNIDDNLIAFYPFNGSANDLSKYKNHGYTENPIPVSDRNEIENSAYLFNGIDDHISIPDKNQLFLNNKFTVAAWVYPKEIKTQSILRKGSHVNGEKKVPYGLSMSGSNDIIFSISTDTGNMYQTRKSGYEINQWYHVVGVFDNDSIYLFVNGKLESTSAIEGVIIDENLPLLIGTRLKIESSTFNGKIDDIRIYNVALCPLEIEDLYNS